ncbi:hypothetical protein O988_02336 [Pseudogymnoascus sp. VKM F-3808]|nr:hypothetical protein O988_02336 [Pseudogymnoascus sp. VKM F-3808]
MSSLFCCGRHGRERPAQDNSGEAIAIGQQLGEEVTQNAPSRLAEYSTRKSGSSAPSLSDQDSTKSPKQVGQPPL